IRSLGSFSYSLYLIHAPIVVVVYAKVVGPHFGTGVTAFLVTAAIAGPVSVFGARLFASVFEIPFQRYRSWARLRTAGAAWLDRQRARLTRPQPVAVAAAAVATAAVGTAAVGTATVGTAAVGTATVGTVDVSASLGGQADSGSPTGPQ